MLNGRLLSHLLDEDEAGSGGFSAFWNAPDFWADLNTSIVPKRAAAGTTPTFTRATTKTFTDWEGMVRTALSGEACFTGARRVRNGVPHSTDFSNVGWTATNVPTLASSADVPPAQGFTASNQITAATGASRGYNFVGLTVGKSYTLSCWVKGALGGEQVFLADTAGTGGAFAVTNVWQRYSRTFTAGNTQAYFSINNLSGQSQTALFVGMQVEDVTGQSNQNPSEYVSVGVLSAPFQGANVDGVQYFATQNGNTVAANVVTAGTGAAIGLAKNQSAYFPTGSALNDFSTPDAPANRFAGDVDVRAAVAPSTWASVGFQVLVAKWGGVAASAAFQFGINSAASGKLIYQWSDGVSFSTLQVSTAAVPFTAGTIGAVRATHSVNNGSGGTTITFYTAPNLSGPWTVLGTPVVVAGTTNVNSGVLASSPLRIGNQSSGSNIGVVGTLYQAQLYNGINGTLAVDFNPQDYTTGTTWASSTTGETWTKNGGASILNNPLLGYSVWQQSTNLALQSEDLSNASWIKTGSTISANAIASPDGNVTADQFIPNNTLVGNASRINQSFSATASQPQTLSFFAKAAGQTTISVEQQGAWAINETGILTFTLSASGSVSSTGTKTGTIVAYANGWYRCIFTVTSTATPGTPGIQVEQAAGSTGDGTNGVYLWGFQIEDAKSFVTPYIATTTAAVTRNADNLNFQASGNVLGATGSAYAEATWANTVPTSGPDVLDTFPSAIQINLGGSGIIGLYDGASRAPGPNLGITAATVQKLATKWDGGAGSCNGAGNGVLGAAAPWVTPALSATLFVGNRQGGGTIVIDGSIRNVKIWKTTAPDAYLTQATT